MLKLLQGDYKEGLELYESRFATLQGDTGVDAGTATAVADPRRWQGEDLCGKRLLDLDGARIWRQPDDAALPAAIERAWRG